MKNKKGFTLIEILAVIIIIGIIAIIAVPSISRYLNSSKDTVYTSYEHSMEDAAKNRIVDCLSGNGDCELPESDEEQRIYLDLLIEEGYLDNMKDPETKNFCEQLVSYVAISGESATNYKYKACLYCGDYYTNDVECRKIEGDSEAPECGTAIGESTRWTNQNRTITIGCSDASSGCLQTVFSKTFSKTTENGKGTIIIRDRSGRTKECEVNAYVDKTLPTCAITASGDFLEGVGWYSLKATALLSNKEDADSKLLTYGMGTSNKNREYNKLTELEVGGGVTTVFGYVKDMAGNEGICSADIRVGTEIPKFNLYYGNIIYPDNSEYYTLSGITEVTGGLKTTSNTPKITIKNTAKYKNVKKVLITLSSGISETTTGTLKASGITKTALMQQGSKEIVFVFDDNQLRSHNSIEIQLGTKTNKTYNVEKIEILTKDGSAWTNQDITMYVEKLDRGMETKQVTYDNKATDWVTTFSKTLTSKTSNIVITRNAIHMESNPQSYSALIDKVVPTVTIKAEKTDGTNVPTDTYVNSGLNFTFTKGTVGESGANIYYCKDTNNTCVPSTLVESGAKITDYNTIKTDYYIRYRIISNAGAISATSSFKAKFDLNRPTCTFATAPQVYQNRTAVITLSCLDTQSTIDIQDLTASAFTLSNGYLTIQSVTKESIANGVKYSITVKGAGHGTTTITLKENQFKDRALNGNTTASVDANVKGVFTVSLNNQSATSAGTATIYELYAEGWYSDANVTTSITKITIPNKNGYMFGGYYTSTNGGGTQIIAANGNIVSNKQSSFTSNTTLYAKWVECGNGNYCINNVKTACPTGTYGNGTTNASTQAAACQNCGNGAWCTGGTTRNTCPAGTYGNGQTNATTQAEACKTCDNGYYCSGGTSKEACGDGKIGTGTGKKNEAEGCKTCAAGTYKTNQTTCSNCGNGAWCTGGAARSTCPAGTYGNGQTNATTQAEACNTCDNGYYCSGGTSKLACGTGKIGTGTGKSTESTGCQTCAAGTYKTNQTTCSNCGNGAWCTGGTARSTCPAGTYGNGATQASTQAAACTTCDNGYYCSGGTSKEACGTGKIGTGTGKSTESTGCQTCAAGTYKTSQTECSNCGNGAWCTGGAARSTCPAGTYGNGQTNATTQAAACQNCGNGAWCTGGTARSTCPAGTYGNGQTNASTQAGACQNCGNGAWCTGGTARSTCPAGTYGNGATQASTQAAACQNCGSGAWCTGGTNRTTCTSQSLCATGETKAKTKAEGCKSCKSWVYVADYGDSDTCGVACPPSCGFPVYPDIPGHGTENHLDEWRCQPKFPFDSTKYFGQYCFCYK